MLYRRQRQLSQADYIVLATVFMAICLWARTCRWLRIT